MANGLLEDGMNIPPLGFDADQHSTGSESYVDPSPVLESVLPLGGEEEGEVESDEDVFDPADHTIVEVKEYVEDHPFAIESVVELEMNGRSRSTLLDWLRGHEVSQPTNVADVERPEDADVPPSITTAAPVDNSEVAPTIEPAGSEAGVTPTEI